ncbi:5-deoxy-glucuronate isomerase [Mycoplasmoides fastidiosum]|uniref:5-deoxy-glucuronate isomerase n=1 Tax=Mycoplasmoides fastidiosum TaxID=92758 RepID=A0ABU0LZJ3_9BACT|nr:5-deoxy-glucuronate isomerase [Mycoplasmoides fastidiosum]MDQ0514114.1 5-deoxy-glucuronate isomerase [Mycoplasmoides fastidiosum]UUD37478.1 5-deoxy-glucuronate isomerase [Mycoplasmoides fastidiosum]
MFLKNQHLGTGYHRLLTRTKTGHTLNLDVHLWKTNTEPTTLDLVSSSDETVLLVLTGQVSISINDQLPQTYQRDSLFDQIGTCLVLPPTTQIRCQTHQIPTEVLVLQTPNAQLNQPQIFDPTTVSEDYFGEGQWDNTALRLVRTYFDYDNLPTSNLVVGEVISYPGCWSSYLPHYHDQAELYYFKFDHANGFGISVIGDQAHIVTENDLSVIEPNLVHPVVSAPGYPLYFCWIILHNPNQPWKKDRKIDPNHAWLEAPNVSYWNKKKK